tara:strand:+ start:77 stop:718 length:642 start_codon:yes stop_codon:yes gene_type:complete
MNNIIISIDGPSGAGKEKIAKYIAKKYNLYHLDSGLLYRRLTYLIIKNKVNFYDKNELVFFLKSLKKISTRKNKALRNEKISSATSIIAKNQIVRNFINNQQKIIVKKIPKKRRGCVIDGRDIGSKVFKKAKIKLFIHAKPQIRAKRRHKQLIAQGEKSIYSRILRNINLRDKTDKKRSKSPLVVPKRAVIIDNSYSFKSTIKQINKALTKIV